MRNSFHVNAPFLSMSASIKATKQVLSMYTSPFGGTDTGLVGDEGGTSTFNEGYMVYFGSATGLVGDNIGTSTFNDGYIVYFGPATGLVGDNGGTWGLMEGNRTGTNGGNSSPVKVGPDEGRIVRVATFGGAGGHKSSLGWVNRCAEQNAASRTDCSIGRSLSERYAADMLIVDDGKL